MWVWVTVLSGILAFSSYAESSSQCRVYFSEFKRLENPLKVQRFLERRGLDANFISVKRGDSSFTVYYNNDKVLQFNLFLSFYDVTYSHTLKIESAYRGRGLGTVGYLLLVRELYLRDKTILGSDVTLSKDALSIWRRFETMGYAKDHGFYFQIEESILNKSAQWKEIDEILERSPRPRSFFEHIYRKIIDF